MDRYCAAGKDDLVFPNRSGNPLIASSFWQHYFKSALVACDLSVRFHDLRHTCVALAIAGGAHPKTIQCRDLTRVDRSFADLLDNQLLQGVYSAIGGPLFDRCADGDALACAAFGVNVLTIGLGLAGRGEGAESAQPPHPTAAVSSEWFEVYNASSERWPGTTVPKSFELSVSSGHYFVNPNATEHMMEYSISKGSSQVPLSSLAGAIDEAQAAGLGPGRNFVTYGPWELGIYTTDNVIYHALYRP